MKKLIIVFSTAALLTISPLWAQLPAPNETGVSMGHWHVNARDMEATKKFWAAVGGTPAPKLGQLEVFKFPDVLVILTQAEASGASVGSVVNHVGFLVPNVQQAIAKWKSAGLTVEPGGNNRTDQAFLTSPDGLRIEILEDKAMTIPIRHHHVHYHVPAAAVPEIQSWYAKTFGAKPGMRGQNQAADLPGANLTFSATTDKNVGTRGRALDHVGFEIRNLEAFCKKLEAAGITFVRPYTKTPTGLAIAFITDPWGTYIELTEGLNKL